MRTYNRRFAALGRARRARGALGRRNAGRQFMFAGYTFSPGSALPILKALLGWAWLEVTEGWRSWFARKPQVAQPNDQSSQLKGSPKLPSLVLPYSDSR